MRRDRVVAQDDSLHAPPQFWQTGDLLVHIHELSTPPNGTTYHLGVYDPTPQYPRLTTAAGWDHIPLSMSSLSSE